MYIIKRGGGGIGRVSRYLTAEQSSKNQEEVYVQVTQYSGTAKVIIVYCNMNESE